MDKQKSEKQLFSGNMEKAPLRLIVTSGPTREWMDPVRFLSNPSSGKTGYFLAAQGIALFSEVIYICGPVLPEFRSVEGAENHLVDTTDQMYDAVKKKCGENCLLIMAAAPADFKPEVSQQKIKKTGEATTLRLLPTIDILAEAGKMDYENFIRVGFAAETERIREHALEKMKRKNAHFICANEVFQEERGFASNENTLFVYNRSGQETVIGPARKDNLARILLEYLLQNVQL